eukprot:scaffold6426_cov67-Cyclotella_meneghiniana.AAC.2
MMLAVSGRFWVVALNTNNDGRLGVALMKIRFRERVTRHSSSCHSFMRSHKKRRSLMSLKA